MKFHFICIILPILFICNYASAQNDITFWFAAPEISSAHADRPIYLRFSSGDESANIAISEPANPNFQTINISLNANSSISVDLTSQIKQIENSPDDAVLPYGIQIESNSLINVYYEIAGSRGKQILNSDIFTLKGKNALGTEFYTPFQNYFDNAATVDAWSSFQIVATENNTSVTITPTKNINHHPAGIPYTIVLNKGQTYSARAASRLADDHLSGTHIVSDKPVAVTISDDSMVEGMSYDLGGDQIVPVDILGTSYIALKGSGYNNTDRVFICAVNNQTDIFINGNITPVTTINQGETFDYWLLDSATYITADKPVYVFHVTAFESELGAALLPKLECTGSRRVFFTRSNNERFVINLIVGAGGENSFTLDGLSNIIPGNRFKPVPGTNGQYLYAQLQYTEVQLNSNVPHLIENPNKDFHAGILNGSTMATGFRYGYFSDYGALELGSDKAICKGSNATLTVGFGKDDIHWSTGAQTPTISVSDTGTYLVRIKKGSCILSDSVHVSFLPGITKDILGENISVCADSNLIIKPVNQFSNYLWQDNSTDSVYKPLQSGYYYLEVRNEYNCPKKDSIYIDLMALPEPKVSLLENELKVCWQDSISVDAGGAFIDYLWNTSDTTRLYAGLHTPDDIYSVTVTGANGCKNTNTLYLDCSPYIDCSHNLITPNDDNKNDQLIVRNLKPNKWSLSIYNRWGNRVDYKHNYDNSWSGSNLPDGIYYFHLKHHAGKGNCKGWVEIIR